MRCPLTGRRAGEDGNGTCSISNVPEYQSPAVERMVEMRKIRNDYLLQSTEAISE